MEVQKEVIPTPAGRISAMKIFHHPRMMAEEKVGSFKNIIMFFLAPAIGGISLFVFQIVGVIAIFMLSLQAVGLKVFRR